MQPYDKSVPISLSLSLSIFHYFFLSLALGAVGKLVALLPAKNKYP